MEQTRKRMKFEILLDKYFSNFPCILLTNLIFFVPFGIAIGLCFLLESFVSQSLSILSAFILIVLAFPFYSGVVMVCRNIARGDEKVKVFPTFVKGVKENFLRFALYGVVVALITVLTYYSISVYAKLLSTSWFFYATLFICILIALELLFIFFYIPVMTVTFDLPLKYIIKNSFLMSFGEIKNNFFALLSLAVVLAICFTIVAFCTQALLVVIVTLLLLALIVPATCQYVISFFVYDDMYGSIAQRSEKSEQIEQAIADAREKGKSPQQIVEDYSDVDISSLKDTDDYIFYKGKMIKQSVLLKRALEQRGENQTSDIKEE